MKTRKKKINDYFEKYSQYFDDKDDDLKLIERYFKDNKLNLEEAMSEGKKRAEKILTERKYKAFKITLYEEPFKTERGRVGHAGVFYSPNAADNHKYLKNNLKDMATNIGALMKLLGDVITTPSEIYVRAYFPLPKVKKKHAYELLLFMTGILKVNRDPDYDNIGKAYTDMYNKTLVIDDRIFYKGTIVKLYHVIPKVEIIVTYQEKHDSYTLYEKLIETKMIKEFQENNLIKLKFME